MFDFIVTGWRVSSFLKSLQPILLKPSSFFLGSVQTIYSIIDAGVGTNLAEQYALERSVEQPEQLEQSVEQLEQF